MKTNLILFLLGLMLVSACEKSDWQTAGDFFHLSYKGSALPVWVRGNFNSDVMLITVHGGPGDSGMEQHIAEGFKMLEEDYLLVYWDQRYSGMSQGHVDESLHTPDQYIDDTEKIVELVLSRYPGRKVYMIGHSWGGQLSAGYLGRDNHDELFKGWIDLNGSIYGDMESQLMKNYILTRVPAKLAEPDADKAFWQEIVNFYQENPAPGNYSEPLPYYYVAALRGDAVNWEAVQERNPTPYIELTFKSMFSLSFYTDAFSDEVMERWDRLNYTSELENITIPVLALWGADDGVVPAEVADYVYEHLGTDPAYKSVVKIPDCAHGPQHEAPEVFYNEIKTFIETYKNRK